MQAAAFPTSVLVVDDEPSVLDVFSRVLPDKGLAIRTARSAEEAFQLLEVEGFGCVLADKNLPGADGMEIVRRVRRTQPYCACILMTAYSSTQSAVEALRLGAIDYIEKPFDDLYAIAARIDDAVRSMKAEYEKRALLSRLRIFENEVSQNDAPRYDDEGEFVTPVEILESKVQQATADLRKRSLHLLSRLVASKAAGREVLLSGEAILEELRRLRQQGGDEGGDLRHVEEMVEDHLALARHAQSR